MDINKFSALQIALASPERIESWSYGEVKKPETLNYRTQKTENDGLFCEKIFGPRKDLECSCGALKRKQYKGVICSKCGVEVTKSSVRRERMGHISLVTPVAHIWYLKGSPSRLGQLLNVQAKALEEVVYFISWIVIDPKETTLSKKQILSSTEYRDNQAIYGPDSFVAQTGAEAILALLKDIDPVKEKQQIEEELKTATNDKRKKLIKRLDTVNAFVNSGNKPEWMILTTLPVIPPDLRPMLQLDGGRFAASDMNELYRRIITRNNRLKRLYENGAPMNIVINEKRMIQEAVDALIDNGRRASIVKNSNDRPLKSLSHNLKGKDGRFRKNLLGKRSDFSARSVITVGPDLKMYECGIPKQMALLLFKPYVINELKVQNIVQNSIDGEKLIDSMDPIIWDVVEDVISEHPVILNRAPTLHRLGIQSFIPKLIEGRAIRLHPLVCTAFNADFDGDQMAVHLPLSELARAEAEILMLGSNNILGPKDGKPIVTPSQDMVLGNFYLNMEDSAENFAIQAKEFKDKGDLVAYEEYQRYADNEGHLFGTTNEVLLAYDQKVVHLHSRIAIRASSLKKEGFSKLQNQSYLVTTVGKVIFNNIFPLDFPYINEVSQENLKETPDSDFLPKGTNIKEEIAKRALSQEFKKKDLSLVIAEIFNRYQAKHTSEILDKIKDLGFRFSTLAGMTVSLSDINVAPNKEKYVSLAKEKAAELSDLLDDGLLTLAEWEKHFTKLWDDTKNIIGDEVMNNFPRKNPINMMAVSGARGSKSHFTQLAGMRGLMAKPVQSKSSKEYQPSIVSVPIYSSFREGLDVSEFFLSTHGVRKGLTDTALKVAESGYLTRRLVDVGQDVVVTIDDCHTDMGFKVSTIIDRKNDVIIEPLYERLVGRYLQEPIINPKNKKILYESNTYIDEEIAGDIVNLGIKEVYIRNIFTCQADSGVCRKCYGKNMATGKLVENGEAVGIVAAQSIGEPGTQLTMRTFHTGGVASGNDDITQGLPRVEELFEARRPKKAAVLAKIKGEISEIYKDNDATVIMITNQTESVEHRCDATLNIRLWFKEGSIVEAGEKLTEGQVDPKELLEIAGVTAVQNYIIKEVKKVYAATGIDISDKHIEVVIRQMMKKVVILEGNDTGYITGQTMSINRIRKINEDTIINNRQPAIFGPTLLGISKSSVETDSFLSAASFQETTKVLTEAAINAKIDPLVGLKENVIVGKMIPAGTGSKYDRETTRKIKELADILVNEREERNKPDPATLPNEILT